MKSLFERAKERGVHPKTLWALEEFEAAIATNPKDASAYANLAGHWHYRKQYADALSNLNIALDFQPNHIGALCIRCDLFATCPDDTIRNGQQAIQDAQTAIDAAKTNGNLDGAWYERMLNRLLAAAYAENGNYQRAVEIETESLKLAITKSATRNINEHLDKFRNLEPIRSDTGIR